MATGHAQTHGEAVYARAREVLVGGVNSPVRAMRSIGRDPVFVARARGARLHLAGRLEADAWGGRRRPKLHLEDAAEPRA